MLGVFAYILAGGIVGWLLSLVASRAGEPVLLDVIAGMVGAVVFGWLATPLRGVPELAGEFTLGSLLVAITGAVIPVAAVRLFRRPPAR